MVRPWILVVDDEAYVRELLEEFLTGAGYRVTVATGGKEALTYAEHQSFSAALIDLKMPDMTGLEVMELLKMHHPDIAVVIMTGYPSLESAVGAMQRGAYDYIIKPFKLEELEVVLQRSLQERELRRENQTLRAALTSLEEQLRTYEHEEVASREVEREGHSSQDVRSLADRMYRARSLQHQQTERLLAMIRELVQTQSGGTTEEGPSPEGA